MAQKTDTIVHVNGNILTGELKKMVYGVATWKMDKMGTIEMEVTGINNIKSDKLFEIKMENGNIYFGSIDPSRYNRAVNIVWENERSLVYIGDIVEIYPIKGNIWTRIKGNFSLGANFSKGSNVGTIDFSGNLDYRKEKSFYSLSWHDSNTFQGDSLSSTKAEANLSWEGLLNHSWSIGVLGGISQNTELGYKRKLDFNMAGIRDIMYNEWTRFYVAGGLTITSETPYNYVGTKEDLTGLFQLVWKVFKLSSPKVWVDAKFEYLPYFTGGPRNRVNFNLSPQVSLFSNNFKVGFNYYYNFDSKPTTADASNNDYAINMKLTYSLH